MMGKQFEWRLEELKVVFPISNVFLFIALSPSLSCWIGDSEALALSELLKINSSISQLYLKKGYVI